MVKPIIPQPVQYMQEGNKNSRGGLWPPLHKIFQWTFPLPRRLRILSYFDIMAVLPDITQSVATERGWNSECFDRLFGVGYGKRDWPLRLQMA